MTKKYRIEEFLPYSTRNVRYNEICNSKPFETDKINAWCEANIATHRLDITLYPIIDSKYTKEEFEALRTPNTEEFDVCSSKSPSFCVFRDDILVTAFLPSKEIAEEFVKLHSNYKPIFDKHEAIRKHITKLEEEFNDTSAKLHLPKYNWDKFKARLGLMKRDYPVCNFS